MEAGLNVEVGLWLVADFSLRWTLEWLKYSDSNCLMVIGGCFFCSEVTPLRKLSRNTFASVFDFDTTTTSYKKTEIFKMLPAIAIQNHITPWFLSADSLARKHA